MKLNRYLTSALIAACVTAAPAIASAKSLRGERPGTLTRSIAGEARKAQPITAKRSRETVRVAAAPRAVSHQRGIASYYWQPQMTASGERFNPNAMTAAHKHLRLGTRVMVRNERNGRTVIVRINDRGPYISGRIVDLSRAAAVQIGMTGAGIVPVTLTVLN